MSSGGPSADDYLAKAFGPTTNDIREYSYFPSTTGRPHFEDERVAEIEKQGQTSSHRPPFFPPFFDSDSPPLSSSSTWPPRTSNSWTPVPITTARPQYSHEGRGPSIEPYGSRTRSTSITDGIARKNHRLLPQLHHAGKAHPSPSQLYQTAVHPFRTDPSARVAITTAKPSAAILSPYFDSPDSNPVRATTYSPPIWNR